MLSSVACASLLLQCAHPLAASCGYLAALQVSHNVKRRLATASRAPNDTRGGSDRSRQLPALVRYGRDLTEEARRQLLDPVIGRQDVIQRTMQVLLRRTKHNPLLIGEAGVGKTAVVEGIAQLMAAANPPAGLAGKRLVALDVAAVVAGSTYRGEFEERLQSLLHDCEAAQGSVVLFIDEIHVLGNVEGGLDFANMLKPALARSQLQVIGATTLDEYRQHIETDPALTRRFQPILVEEPSPADCLELLEGLAPRYETFHGVSLPHGTLATAVAAAQRYIPERRLPDSAIDLIDEAAAKVRLAAAYPAGSSSSRVARPGSHTSSSSGGGGGDGGGGSSSSASIQQQGVQAEQQGFSSGSGLAGFMQEWQQEPAPAASASAAASVTSPAAKSTTTVDGNSSTPVTASRVGSSSSSKQQVNSQPPQQQLQRQQQQQQPPQQPPGVGSAHSWSSWIQSKGWRGEAEVHRQQLLEWFGASPAAPLKGSAGHQQTTSERRKKHSQLFGDGARPDFTGSTAALPPAKPSAASAAARQPPHSSSAPPANSRRQQQQQQQSADVTAAALPSLGSSGPLDYTAKPCPHCGTVVLPAQSSDPVRLRCGHCGFRFLNVAPEKLQLGTTVLMDKQQQHTPWAYGTSAVGTPQLQQQQQQGGWVSERPPSLHQHQFSLSDTPADVAAVAAVGGATAAAHTGPPSRRTTVALQERHGSEDTPAAPAAAAVVPDQYQLPVVQPVMSASDAVAAVAAAAAAANAAPSGSASISTEGVQASEWSSDAAGVLHGHAASGSSSSSSSSSSGGAKRGAVGARAVVNPSDILQVVSEATGIPQQLLTGFTAGATATAAASPAATAATALQELNSIHAALSAAVQGQHAAVGAVIGALRLSRMGLAPHQHTPTGLLGGSSLSTSDAAGSARPALSLLFQGPSGVAKTTMAKTLAEALMPGEPQGVLVFSCGELSERHSISRLVGAPPGYVGYGKGGLLTEAIRRRPHSCVLFDDVERAHPDVVGLLLQAVEEGYLMDSMGHSINLRSAVFLFTANTNRPAVTYQGQSTAGVPAGALSAGNGAAVAAAATASGVVRGVHTLAGVGDGGSSWTPCASGSSNFTSSSSSSSSRGFYTMGGSGSEGAELTEPDEPPAAEPAPAAAAIGSGTPPTGAPSSASSMTPAQQGGSKDAMIAELGSRVDDVIQFEPLNDVTMAGIVAQQLQQAVEQARMQGVRLEVQPQAAAWLARAGCSETQGARPLVQLIRRHLLVPLAAAVMDAVAGGSSTEQQRQGDPQQQQLQERAGAGGVWAIAMLAVSRTGVPQLQLQKL